MLKNIAVGLSACVFVLALVLAVLAAAGGSEPTSFGQRIHHMGDPAWAYSLAGQVNASPLLLAIITNHSGWTEAYASDGVQVSEWFGGPIQKQALDLMASDGAHLQATLTSTGASGTLQLGSGPVLTFTLTQVAKPAGLYRVKQQIGETVYLGGWVLLPDGRQAGVIETATQTLGFAPA